MVHNKHFKALVRQRMAKTGERYTTARRQLLASQTPIPTASGVVSGYPRTALGATAAAGQYDAALWQRVLAQAGIKNPATNEAFTTAMLAGLGGGIGFMVATFAYEEVTTATVVLRAHPEPYTERMLQRSAVALERTSTTSPRIATQQLDATLEADKVSVVRVTHGTLPWVDSDAAEYQDSIDVAIVGRHDEHYLVDGGGPSLGEDDIEAFRSITSAELAKARGQRKTDKHWAANITLDQVPISLDELTTNVRSAMSETTGRLLGTLPLEGIPASWLPKFGVQGMRTWAELLRDQRTKRGWPAMFANEQRLQTGLRMVQDTAFGSRWGGPGGLRGLYADFLVEASALPGLGRVQDAAPIYRQLAPLWDRVMDTIDPEIAAPERIVLFEEMAQQLDELASLEEHAAHVLAASLNH
ncbi:MAG TPA: DUF4872 domain-containing protein [Enteractinococcus sp.]